MSKTLTRGDSRPAGKAPEREDGERSEPASSAGGFPAAAPPTEVLAVAKRRRFTAQYKLQVLQEADACRAPGELGALLRREGLYSSHLSSWREQRRQGALAALSDVKRGRKATPKEAKEVERMRREIVRLQRRLDQAERIIEIQKKVSEILGIPLRTPAPDEIDS
jgi:transposase-like protein